MQNGHSKEDSEKQKIHILNNSCAVLVSNVQTEKNIPKESSSINRFERIYEDVSSKNQIHYNDQRHTRK